MGELPVAFVAIPIAIAVLLILSATAPAPTLTIAIPVAAALTRLAPTLIALLLLIALIFTIALIPAIIAIPLRALLIALILIRTVLVRHGVLAFKGNRPERGLQQMSNHEHEGKSCGSRHHIARRRDCHPYMSALGRIDIEQRDDRAVNTIVGALVRLDTQRVPVSLLVAHVTLDWRHGVDRFRDDR